MYKRTILALYLLVLATPCFGQVWTCESEGLAGDPPWMSIPNKGTTNDPLIIKVIFVRFPNTIEAERYITAGNLAMLNNGETILANESLGAHNVEYSVIYKPGDLTNSEKWDAVHESFAYAISDSVNSWANSCQDYWAGGHDSIWGALQEEILRHMQDAYDAEYGQTWQSPLSGADAILFVYTPEGSNGNPLSEGLGGVGELFLSPDCPELARICDGAPVSEEYACGYLIDRVLYGTILVIWNSGITTLNSVAMVHEWGHALGLFHTPDSEGGVAGNCYFGAY